MTIQTRRRFLEASAAVVAQSFLPAEKAADIRLGLFVGGKDPEAALKKVHDLGLPTCQFSTEEFTADMAAHINDAAKRYGVEITALNSHGPGREVWDFYDGPATIGLVPRATRRARLDHLKRASDFAKSLGIPAMHGHAGFIPEDPNDPVYKEVVEALRELITHLKDNGQFFLYETGQESPITLLRTIRDVGLDNQFVNLDTANLILYGKGHPIDALDVIGSLVRGLHAKDGLFPTEPRRLGHEVPIGQGKVDFPLLIQRLRDLNYRGPMTIERETSGPQQIEDVRKAKIYLEKLLAM